MILDALLALWHHFWAQFRHLGVTFGAFWMHCSRQKTDWGAKGAQGGATPEIKSPIWTHFWDTFLDASRFLVKKHENNQEHCLQTVSTRVSLFRGWRPFGHLWRPNLFFDTKSASKMLQKWPQGASIEPKSDAKVLKVHPKLSTSKP